MKNIIAICLLVLSFVANAQHPAGFFTKQQALLLRSQIDRYPLLSQSYRELKRDVDAWLDKEVDVPFPKDPAGGYTHDRHKSNYMLMFNSGLLYQLTGNEKYATLVKKTMLKYAALNPQLGNHPQATSSSPGHIFWQALNDANWLVYAGMAYDLVYTSCTAEERKQIENGAFKPEVDFFTRDLESWFNLIHNHGVWACAGVGIAGIATNNREWVDMALYGTKKDGKAGFLAQLDGLFSPDGYYTEGPYYVRYALLPFYLFANALDHARPTLKIFNYRQNILHKALIAGLQQTNTDGAFFPLNDALKEKDYTSNELVTAIDIAWSAYGADPALLYVANRQGKVLPHRGGAAIAAALQNRKAIPATFPYRSVEYTDGVKGNEGGVSFLRAGKGNNLTTLICKYTSHGLSHGHFDKLNINLYDKGNEILTDYGSVRFIGIEQKFGGRYLPENKGYASQTIAHNTVVLDETSHFNGKELEAEKYHADKLFSDLSNPVVQVIAAIDSHAYNATRLARSVYLLELPGENRMLVDLFRVHTDHDAIADLPFQYNGQLISTNFRYEAFTRDQKALGTRNGYAFIWKEAASRLKDTLAQLTFLNEHTFYTISTAINGEADVFLTRTGAGDPKFNLRREPAFIIRQKSQEPLFASCIEIHGSFDAIAEFSTDAYPSVKAITVLDNKRYTVVEVSLRNRKLLLAQCNEDAGKDTRHQWKDKSWTGPWAVWLDDKKLN